ncbi:putative enoyl-CoA hydratase/isomerase [Actinacidiphila reveromycinica]|uniref:Putative enoyl-CoA hydratase/isomerase n=1 Tax=Actinacidiphila reveromycinica TaxID=659352 RepID=A0A7U3UYU0_9ACTN|nr:enoyl-CoA hydratase/isomerase family protein [Streptomyces sp. SN-593]BBB01358.1 putative enoyl-CoA hydratase/isomerase [Streptomyces sp. SN-593]
MAPTDYTTLDLAVEDRIAVLTLDRPRARNAIDAAMRTELRDAVDRVTEDTSIRGLVLTGSGSAFCAGGDIRGMQERMDLGPRVGEVGWRRQRELHDTLTRLFQLDRPTVAAVNGPALGLGLDLALTCDFLFLADTASVASSFVKRGLVSDGGGMFHLPRRVGLSTAKDLVFSGRSVPADEALRIGLADRVVPAGDLRATAVGYLRGLATHPAMAQALGKDILNRSLELSIEEIHTLSGQAQAFCYMSPDHQQSVREFLDARQARKTNTA